MIANICLLRKSIRHRIANGTRVTPKSYKIFPVSSLIEYTFEMLGVNQYYIRRRPMEEKTGNIFIKKNISICPSILRNVLDLFDTIHMNSRQEWNLTVLTYDSDI